MPDPNQLPVLMKPQYRSSLCRCYYDFDSKVQYCCCNILGVYLFILETINQYTNHFRMLHKIQIWPKCVHIFLHKCFSIWFSLSNWKLQILFETTSEGTFFLRFFRTDSTEMNVPHPRKQKCSCTELLHMKTMTCTDKELHRCFNTPQSVSEDINTYSNIKGVSNSQQQ